MAPDKVVKSHSRMFQEIDAPVKMECSSFPSRNMSAIDGNFEVVLFTRICNYFLFEVEIMGSC